MRHAATVGVSYIRDLKGMHILQQMEQLGRPIGTIIYPKASRLPSIVYYMAIFNKTTGII